MWKRLFIMKSDKRDMKKQIFFLFFALVACTLSAKPIDKETAKQKALSFLSKENSRKMRKASSKDLSLSSVENSFERSFYVFNVGQDDGFVLVSANDQTESILGYVDEGSFDEGSIPENMKAWLQFYQEEINRLGDVKEAQTQSLDNKEAIAPLIATRWDQSTPYNYECHLGIIDSYALTGCVATTMAQVMNYYQWPKTTSEEIPAYTINYSGYGSKEWEAQPIYSFDWDNMKNTYTGSESTTDVSAIAVSKLMRYCGQSVKMSYSNISSSASTYFIPGALKDFFGYDADLTLVSRSSYTIQGWADLIYNELMNKRPVIYTGQSASEGHGFICDGYDGNGLFHINWGWSGMSNGYFRINVLDPQMQGSGGVEYHSGYKASQVFARGIYPNAPAQAPNVMVLSFSSKGKKVQYEQGEYMITDMAINVANVSHPNISAEIGVTIESQSTKDTKPLFTDSMSLGADMIREKLTLKLGALPDGEYTCYPSFRLSADGEWTPCIGYENNCIKVTIANGIATMSNVMPYKLVTVSSDNKDVYAVGKEIKFTANLKVVEGEMHDVLYCIAEPFDEMGNLDSDNYSRMDLSTNFYASAGETFAAKISSGGLSEGSYLISVIAPSMNSSHRICIIEVRDGVTAIRDIDAAAAAPSAAPAYNLQGQQVDSSYKGIIIRNGKKILR